MKTLYYNGTILPMDCLRREQALLTENGRILACGAPETFSLSRKEAQYIDLQGRTLLPAFFDGHSHLSVVARSLSFPSLGEAKSFQDLRTILSDFLKKGTKHREDWVIALGYDQNFLEEGRHPTASFLDEIFPESPVLLVHASGHMGIANSRALQKMGVTRDTADPEGGRIGRIPGTMEPSGYLEETAFTKYSAAVSREENHDGSMEKAQRLYFSHGVTTICEGLTKAPEWTLLSCLSEEEKLSADVICYVDIKDSAAVLEKNKSFLSYKSHLRIGGYKLFLDGSPQGRTAWMTTPYLNGEEGYCGYPIYRDDEVLAYLKKAQRENMPIHVHCNGDAAAEQMLFCYRQAYEAYKNEIRPVMIHAQLLRPDQLPELRSLHVIASFFAAHVYHWGDVHLKNFGKERAGNISPANSALRRGVLFNFHQDSPVIAPNMLETVWCAVNRVTKQGIVLGEEQRLSPFEALRAVTINAAYATFEETEKGTLSPGKRADLVILDRDPLSCPPEELRDIRVLETVKDGKTVFTGPDS